MLKARQSAEKRVYWGPKAGRCRAFLRPKSRVFAKKKRPQGGRPGALCVSQGQFSALLSLKPCFFFSFVFWTLFFPPGPAFSGASSGYSTSFTPTGQSVGGSAVPSASRNVSSIRELLFSADEKSLVAGENHLPQLSEFRNVRVVRFLYDARLKFKRLSH